MGTIPRNRVGSIRGNSAPKPLNPSNPKQQGLAVDVLQGDNFGNTVADGSFRSVSISVETFNRCADICQQFLNALPWTGEARVYPRF